MKVLVTGADGFIGSHLVELLVERGYQVKALCQYNSFNSWGWLEDIGCLSEVEVISGDVRDPYLCREISKNIDVIFNLAALIAIPYSYVAPGSYIETNINGALNICQAALANGVSRVVQVSTSEVYGTARFVPINETHPLQAQSPYSASKIGADAIALSHFLSFGLDVVVARPFNTYGPRQSARALIPTIITQLANDVDELKLGDLRPTRDFNYVEDTCNGILSLGECEDAKGKAVNIGSNFEISVGETVRLIKRLMGSSVSINTDAERIRPENSEVFRLWCDNSLIKGLTGFEPRTDLESGLRKTIDWFSNESNLRKYKHNIYNV